MPFSVEEQEELENLIEELNIPCHTGWKNFTENNRYSEALVLDIKDSNKLCAIVKKIHAFNLNKEPENRIILRVSAGRPDKKYAESYSFTEGVKADVILRLTGKEFRTIKTTDKEQVMSVGASMQIGEVDKTLYDTFKLALPTSSLIPYVTIGGLCANAGHGTGKDQPGFCGLIKKMKFCLPNGEIVTIDEKHQDFETIRGAHLGLFGILLEVDLQCTPAKKMHCIMEAISIPELIKKVKSGDLLKYPYVSVMYVPSYQDNELTSTEHKNVIIYSWTPVDRKTKDHNSHPRLSHLIQALEIKMEETLNIPKLMRKHPHLIPYITRYLVSTAAIGKHNSESIGPWHTVHYQTAFPRDIDDADYLFSVDDDCNQILIAIEEVVNTLTRYAKQGKYPITDAVYFRLFQGTHGGLSTSPYHKNKYVCGWDMVSSNGIAGYANFKEEMAKFFIQGTLSAKPHWGKFIPPHTNLKDIYGDNFIEFNETITKWYKHHGIDLNKNMLFNAFACEIIPSVIKPVVIKPKKHNLMMIEQNSTSNFQDIAKNMLYCIKEDSPYAEALRQKLQELETLPIKPSHDSLTFFKSDKLSDNEVISLSSRDSVTLESDEPAKEKRCCVLL